MRTVICDLPKEQWAEFGEVPPDTTVILNDGKIKKWIAAQRKILQGSLPRQMPSIFRAK